MLRIFTEEEKELFAAIQPSLYKHYEGYYDKAVCRDMSNLDNNDESLEYRLEILLDIYSGRFPEVMPRDEKKLLALCNRISELYETHAMEGQIPIKLLQYSPHDYHRAEIFSLKNGILFALQRIEVAQQEKEVRINSTIKACSHRSGQRVVPLYNGALQPEECTGFFQKIEYVRPSINVFSRKLMNRMAVAVKMQPPLLTRQEIIDIYSVIPSSAPVYYSQAQQEIFDIANLFLQDAKDELEKIHLRETKLRAAINLKDESFITYTLQELCGIRGLGVQRFSGTSSFDLLISMAQFVRETVSHEIVATPSCVSHGKEESDEGSDFFAVASRSYPCHLASLPSLAKQCLFGKHLPLRALGRLEQTASVLGKDVNIPHVWDEQIKKLLNESEYRKILELYEFGKVSPNKRMCQNLKRFIKYVSVYTLWRVTMDEWVLFSLCGVKGMKYAHELGLINKETERERDGFTPLHIAAFCGDTEAMLYAVNVIGIPVVRTHHHSVNPLHYAAMSGNPEAMRCAVYDLQIDQGVLGMLGQNALICAARLGTAETIQYAINDLGLELNCQDERGATLLHYAVDGRNVESILCLRAMGLDPYVKDGKGHDAFWHAAYSKKPKAARKLIAALQQPLEDLVSEVKPRRA